jgi:hypothetical protein
MTGNSELKPLAPEELEKKISEVNAKLGINKDKNVRTKEIYEGLSLLSMTIAVGFTVFGVYTLYNDSYSARIVGGDAYNFIIYATRGTAWICVGIVCSIIGLTFAVFANTSNNSN